jgi:hypothetical protein
MLPDSLLDERRQARDGAALMEEDRDHRRCIGAAMDKLAVRKAPE